MKNLLCISYDNDNPLAGIEARIFALAKRLETLCDSIARCEISVEGPKPGVSSRECWSVRLKILVFGHEISIASHHPANDAGDALDGALRAAFEQASGELDVIARDHCGCTRRQGERLAAAGSCCDDSTPVIDVARSA